MNLLILLHLLIPSPTFIIIEQPHSAVKSCASVWFTIFEFPAESQRMKIKLQENETQIRVQENASIR